MLFCHHCYEHHYACNTLTFLTRCNDSSQRTHVHVTGSLSFFEFYKLLKHQLMSRKDMVELSALFVQVDENGDEVREACGMMGSLQAIILVR